MISSPGLASNKAAFSSVAFFTFTVRKTVAGGFTRSGAGVSCGTVWTAPYRVDISKALKQGSNDLKIEVVNTWANRMIGDARVPIDKRITSTVYPFKMEGKPLLPAGLLGPVRVEVAAIKGK